MGSWRCPCASPAAALSPEVALCRRPAELGSHAGLYLQSRHSPGLCLAARFLCSVLISQGASFGLIIPTGINRTAAAIPASAASFAEQQCGLLDKAGASSQEHGKANPAPARSLHQGLGGLSTIPRHRGQASLGARRALQTTMPCWPLCSGGTKTTGERAHTPQHHPQPDP